MVQLQDNKKKESISNYNTFQVFQDIYKGETGEEDYWQLKPPVKKARLGFLAGVFIFLFILSAGGFGIYPVLSYILKTPYPLLVIAEDTMRPVLERNDLILVRGVVNKAEIEPNDLVVCAQIISDSQNLTVQRVVEVDKVKGQMTVKSEAAEAVGTIIEDKQVVGKVMGEDKPIKLSFIGKIVSYLAGK